MKVWLLHSSYLQNDTSKVDHSKSSSHKNWRYCREYMQRDDGFWTCLNNVDVSRALKWRENITLTSTKLDQHLWFPPHRIWGCKKLLHIWGSDIKVQKLGQVDIVHWLHHQNGLFLSRIIAFQPWTNQPRGKDQGKICISVARWWCIYTPRKIRYTYVS